MWSHTLPELNPIDFSVWSMLKAKVSAVAHPSVDDLKTSFLREWAKIPQEMLCVPWLVISDK